MTGKVPAPPLSRKCRPHAAVARGPPEASLSTGTSGWAIASALRAAAAVLEARFARVLPPRCGGTRAEL